MWFNDEVSLFCGLNRIMWFLDEISFVGRLEYYGFGMKYRLWAE